MLRAAYAAFNARDIDAALATMSPEVTWPKAFKGGFVRGHAAPFALTGPSKWSEIDPHVEPVGFSQADDGRIVVDVHQVGARPGGRGCSATSTSAIASRSSRA